MQTLRYITQPGDYGSLKLRGTNRNDQLGLVVVVPDRETITFDTLDISNVFVPLIKKGNGLLRVNNEVILSEYGGDGMNFLGPRVTIKKTYTRNNTPTRTYDMHEILPGETVRQALKRLKLRVYDHRLLKPVKYRGKWVLPSYHVDGIFQAYAVDHTGYRLDPDGCISDIRLPFIDAELRGPKTQGIMCSEACRYTGFQIGTESMEIMLDAYPFAGVFNQLDQSQIGSSIHTNVNGQFKIRNVKGSKFRTYGNTIEGLMAHQVIMPKGSYQRGHFRHGNTGFTEDELRAIEELQHAA